MTITEFIEAAAHNKIIQLVVLAIVCDTVFGVLRAVKEKKFNSCAGIDGAIRKVGMLILIATLESWEQTAGYDSAELKERAENLQLRERQDL